MYTARRIFFPAALAIIVFFAAGAPRLAQGMSEADRLNSEAADFFEKGRVLEALGRLEIAVTQAPEDPIILSNLGFVYQSLGRYSDGVRVLKKAISIDPMNTDAHNVLGICHFYLGNMEAAISEWEWVARVDPNNEAVKLNIALARGEAPPDTSLVTKYQAAPDIKPRSAFTAEELFYEGKKAYKAGNYQGALGFLLDVLEVKPSSMLSHYYLGLAYGRLGNAEEAKTHLREYLLMESYPTVNPEAYKLARSTFNYLSRTGMMPPLGVASDLDAGRFFHNGKKAYLNKDFFGAIHYLKEALVRKPESFPSNYYIGLAFGAVGDKERAVYHLSKCLVLLDPYQRDYNKNKAHIQQTIERVIKK